MGYPSGYIADGESAGTATSVWEVGYQVGFNNLHYFSRLFKMLEGITPKAYRQQHGGLDE